MQEWVEHRINLPGVSVMIGTSQWTGAQDWACPESNYVVCQRLSEGHAALRLESGAAGTRQVYGQVRALGFMPSSGTIRMHPLGRPLRTLNCFFERSYFEATTQIDAPGWLDLAGPFMAVRNPALDLMMQRIHAELTRPGFGGQQVIEAASTMIAVEMARLGRAPAAAAYRAASGLAPWQLHRIRERIAAGVDLGFPRVQELAELCGVSRGHLMRMFKHSTGSALHRLIAGERLCAARRMLAENRLSIREIATRLGFSSPGHFSNAFLREECVRPSEYRRRARADGSFRAAPH